MANTNIPMFAVGKRGSILPAISSGKLTYPAYVFCTDTNSMVFVDKNLTMQDVKGYNQDSIIRVNELPTEGIREDAFYICQGIGYLYVNSVPVPMFRDISTPQSYNDLTDIPILNLVGTEESNLVLADLEDGCYSVKGQYQVGGSISDVYILPKKILFLIDSDESNKYITKFGAGKITTYTISLESGEGTSEEYPTKQWIAEQGYTTATYVDEAIEALYDRLRDEVLITKLSQLENDMGFLTANDINGIGRDSIVDLF